MALTAVTLSYLRWLRERLAGDGIAVDAVIVAADANLDLAPAYGFTAVEHDGPLGSKYNAGIRKARETGADTVVQWASDNWADPAYFLTPPRGRRVVTSRHFAMVSEDGAQLAFCDVLDASNPYGAGPFMFPAAIARKDPVDATVGYGVDRSLIEGLGAEPVWRDMHPLQFVSFKTPESLTSFEDLLPLAVDLPPQPWSVLRTVYPRDLVEKARALYP